MTSTFETDGENAAVVFVTSTQTSGDFDSVDRGLFECGAMRFELEVTAEGVRVALGAKGLDSALAAHPSVFFLSTMAFEIYKRASEKKEGKEEKVFFGPSFPPRSSRKTHAMAMQERQEEERPERVRKKMELDP